MFCKLKDHLLLFTPNYFERLVKNENKNFHVTYAQSCETKVMLFIGLSSVNFLNVN